jgi:lysylphosphatidylglycerol synthetase-like protein (DUF2156 family)
VHFLPWWALVACLAASAVAAYLLLGRTQAGDSRWALFALTAAAAPVVLAGAMAAAVVLSTLLYAFLDDRAVAPTGRPEPAPEPAERTERTGAEADNEGTDLGTTSEPTAPATSSPSASPGASPSASASASP